MEPVIQTLPSRLVVGIGGTFISALSPESNNLVVIPKLWHEFINRVEEIPLRKNQTAVGCVWCLDSDEKGPRECYYLAGAEVTGSGEVPEGMEAREIPAGRYAVFVHRGSLDTLGETMSSIHRTWLPGSGHRRREAPEVELYGEKFQPDSETSELEICVPIV